MKVPYKVREVCYGESSPYSCLEGDGIIMVKISKQTQIQTDTNLSSLQETGGGEDEPA